MIDINGTQTFDFRFFQVNNADGTIKRFGFKQSGEGTSPSVGDGVEIPLISDRPSYASAGAFADHRLSPLEDPYPEASFQLRRFRAERNRSLRSCLPRTPRSMPSSMACISSGALMSGILKTPWNPNSLPRRGVRS